MFFIREGLSGGKCLSLVAAIKRLFGAEDLKIFEHK